MKTVHIYLICIYIITESGIILEQIFYFIIQYKRHQRSSIFTFVRTNVFRLFTHEQNGILMFFVVKLNEAIVRIEYSLIVDVISLQEDFRIQINK